VVLSSQAAHAQSAEDYVNRGDEKRKAGDLDGAIAEYSKAIEINPTDASIYISRGQTKRMLGDYKGAITITIRR